MSVMFRWDFVRWTQGEDVGPIQAGCIKDCKRGGRTYRLSRTLVADHKDADGWEVGHKGCGSTEVGKVRVSGDGRCVVNTHPYHTVLA